MSKKILCVDDDPDILELISSTLTKEGYSVVTATNGHEAIEKYSNENPVIILLDIMMPEMDGIDVCKAIRKDNTKNPVILFLTAKTGRN